MTKQCRRCFHLKPLEGFHREPKAPDGRKATCKSCASYRVRAASYRKKNPHKPMPASNSVVRAMAYYKRLQDKFFKTLTEVSVPLKVRNVSQPVPNVCVMKRVNDLNVLCLSTLQGSREYPLEMIGPEQFIDITTQLGFELVVPERMPHGETQS